MKNESRSRYFPVLIYSVAWVIIIIIQASLLIFVLKRTLSYSLIDSTIFNGLFALLGIGIWNMMRYSESWTKKFPEALLYHIPAAVVTITLQTGIGYLITKEIISDNPADVAFLESTWIFRIISSTLIYTLILLVFYLFRNIEDLKQESERASELTALIRDAELKLLRSQLRPHFLFNSLNSISSLTMSNPGKAQEMVIKLSEFMRYSLGSSEDSMISIKDELYHLNLYLEIEKVRFGEKLQVQTDIPEKCMHLKVPSLILQPLIENAVKYGVYESLEENLIKISAACESGFLKISITNRFDPDSMPKQGTLSGLMNVRLRLRNRFNADDLMKTEKNNGIFEVTLSIPQT